MLGSGNSYNEVYDAFRWQIPEYYNIGVDICDKHAHQRYRLALVYEDDDGRVKKYSFRELKQLSNQLANTLYACGIGSGDRVGILLPQRPETAITHIATYKIGAVAVPLFTLFGTDALEYRLGNSRTACVVTDAANLTKLMEVRGNLPGLKQLIVVRDRQDRGGLPDDPDMLDFWAALAKGSSEFNAVRTRAEDPALIIYTSGTTGPPKGALHAHRTLLGHLPGVELPHNFFPQAADFFWTPADWAWIGGLIDVLFPSWHHGIPVLAHRARKFDPEFAFELIARHDIRNLFLPPTALKLMRQVESPQRRHRLRIRSIGSGGETLGRELLDWGKEHLGVTINEFYGQTEANLIVGNCAQIMAVQPGSMGKPIPGHVVEIIDDEGRVLSAGDTGHIAVKRPDPVMFLEYWQNPEATAQKFIGDWCVTGDIGRKDEDGHLWFIGRDDDLITSAGYRIGPGEIEDCLIKHPAVSMAAVIGVADEVRTEIIKAFIVLNPGTGADEILADDIRAFVKQRLAAHEYPRQIEFVNELPMTATGKIIRKQLRQREIEKGGSQ